MPIKVRIPTPLQKLTKNQTEILVCGQNIQELINNIDSQHNGVKERICDERGNVRRFVNIYLNGEDIRFLQAEQTKLKDGDEVAIIPAIAGGS